MICKWVVHLVNNSKLLFILMYISLFKRLCYLQSCIAWKSPCDKGILSLVIHFLIK